MAMTARDKIRRGFDWIYDNHPYAAGIAASWKVTEYEPEWFIQHRLPQTAATNGPELIYCRPFVESRTIREVCDLVLHEVGHVLLGHHFRFKNKSARIWNLAADAAMNDSFQEYYAKDGMVWQEGVFPGQPWRVARFKKDDPRHAFESIFAKLEPGKSSEYYLEILEEEAKNQTKPPKKTLAKGSKAQKGAGQGDPDESEDGESGEGEGAPEDGEDEQGLQGQPDGTGEVMPHPATEEDEIAVEQAIEEWEEKVAQSVNQAKKHGDLPGWMKEVAKIYEHKSVVDWKLEFRQWMTISAPISPTYARPNRRSAYRDDIILPSIWGKTVSEGCVLADTSGSMAADRDLGVVLPEIEKMMRLFPSLVVTLMQADTRLIDGATKRFTNQDFPLKMPLEWRGRGGTDLSSAIHKIAKDKKFNWLIIVSDMQWRVSSCPDPKIPVLWLTTQEIYSDSQKPKFGKLLGPISGVDQK